MGWTLPKLGANAKVRTTSAGDVNRAALVATGCHAIIGEGARGWRYSEDP